MKKRQNLKTQKIGSSRSILYSKSPRKYISGEEIYLNPDNFDNINPKLSFSQRIEKQKNLLKRRSIKKIEGIQFDSVTFKEAMSHTLRRRVMQKKLLNPFSPFYYKTGIKKLNDDIEEYKNELKKEKEDDQLDPFVKRSAMDNNFAIFNNDVYANFPDIKFKTFEIFTKLVKIYLDDCENDKKFSTDTIETKRKRDLLRKNLIKNWGGVDYDTFTAKNKKGNIVRVGERIANPTHLLKVIFF